MDAAASGAARALCASQHTRPATVKQQQIPPYQQQRLSREVPQLAPGVFDASAGFGGFGLPKNGIYHTRTREEQETSTATTRFQDVRSPTSRSDDWKKQLQHKLYQPPARPPHAFIQSNKLLGVDPSFLDTIGSLVASNENAGSNSQVTSHLQSQPLPLTAPLQIQPQKRRRELNEQHQVQYPNAVAPMRKRPRRLYGNLGDAEYSAVCVAFADFAAARALQQAAGFTSTVPSFPPRFSLSNSSRPLDQSADEVPVDESGRRPRKSKLDVPVRIANGPSMVRDRTVVIFCKRDFMRFQAVKIWRRYHEQQQQQRRGRRRIRVANKRMRYNRDEMDETPRPLIKRAPRQADESPRRGTSSLPSDDDLPDAKARAEMALLRHGP